MTCVLHRIDVKPWLYGDTEESLRDLSSRMKACSTESTHPWLQESYEILKSRLPLDVSLNVLLLLLSLFRSHLPPSRKRFVKNGWCKASLLVLRQKKRPERRRQKRMSWRWKSWKAASIGKAHDLCTSSGPGSALFLPRRLFVRQNPWQWKMASWSFQRSVGKCHVLGRRLPESHTQHGHDPRGSFLGVLDPKGHVSKLFFFS